MIIINQCQNEDIAPHHKLSSKIFVAPDDRQAPKSFNGLKTPQATNKMQTEPEETPLAKMRKLHRHNSQNLNFVKGSILQRTVKTSN